MRKSSVPIATSYRGATPAIRLWVYSSVKMQLSGWINYRK